MNIKMSRKRNMPWGKAFLLVVTLPIAGFASAVPVYYTFTGVVSGVYDAAGIAEASGVEVGDEVSYTYMVDRDRSRSYGNVEYFYADLVAGGLIDSTTSRPTYEYNIGVEVDARNDWAAIYGDEAKDLTVVFTSENKNQTGIWELGAVWKGFEQAVGKTKFGKAVTALYSKLTLTGISGGGPRSVPELDGAGAPIALALIAGLLGMRMERRRRSISS